MSSTHRLSENARNHNDKGPALARSADGTLWAVWQSYRMKEDRILARPVRNGRRGPIIEVSDRPGINFQPEVASDGDGASSHGGSTAASAARSSTCPMAQTWRCPLR